MHACHPCTTGIAGSCLPLQLLQPCCAHSGVAQASPPTRRGAHQGQGWGVSGGIPASTKLSLAHRESIQRLQARLNACRSAWPQVATAGGLLSAGRLSPGIRVRTPRPSNAPLGMAAPERSGGQRQGPAAAQQGPPALQGPADTLQRDGVQPRQPGSGQPVPPQRRRRRWLRLPPHHRQARLTEFCVCCWALGITVRLRDGSGPTPALNRACSRTLAACDLASMPLPPPVPCAGADVGHHGDDARAAGPPGGHAGV